MKQPFLRRSRALRAAAAAALCASLAAALFTQFRSSLRIHRAFQRRDSVAEAQNWIFERFPRGAALAFDDYLGPAGRGVPCEPFFVQRLPEFWPGTRRNQAPEPASGGGVGFYLRNGSFPGRLGNRFPASRRLLPEFASNEVAFARDNALVAAWRPAPDGCRPVFSQYDVELWALSAPRDRSGPPVRGTPWRTGPPEDAPEIGLSFPRPASLVEAGAAFRGEVSAPAPLGAVRALRIVGKRRTMQPPPPDSGSRVVFFHVSGTVPATIRAEGSVLKGSFRLAPGEAVAVPLDPAAFERAAAADPFPGFRVRMKGDDRTSLCIGFFARDGGEAARLLREIGGPALAGREADATAAESGGTSPGAADAIDAWRSGTGPEPRVGGIPFGFVEALARLRLSRAQLAPGTRFPVLLPPGDWRVEIELPADIVPPDPETRLFAFQSSPLERADRGDGRNVWKTTVSPTSPALLETDEAFVPSPALAVTGADGIEILWDAVPAPAR